MIPPPSPLVLCNIEMALLLRDLIGKVPRGICLEANWGILVGAIISTLYCCQEACPWPSKKNIK